MYDDELTSEEREAFRTLPREHQPGDPLEERTVLALRARGLIRSGLEQQTFRSPASGLRLSPTWAFAAAAAAVAIFAGGFSLGQWLETRRAREALAAMHEQDTARTAALVQQAGSAYVTALGRLADLAGSSGPRELQQGREVATNILHAAASQLVRLEPDEPVATRILQGLDRAAVGDTNTLAVADSRRVIWF